MLSNKQTTDALILQAMPLIGGYIAHNCKGADATQSQGEILDQITQQYPAYKEIADGLTGINFRACIERLRKEKGGKYRAIGSNSKGYYFIQSAKEMRDCIDYLRGRANSQLDTIQHLETTAQKLFNYKKDGSELPLPDEEECAERMREIYRSLGYHSTSNPAQRGSPIANIFCDLTDKKISYATALQNLRILLAALLP